MMWKFLSLFTLLCLLQSGSSKDDILLRVDISLPSVQASQTHNLMTLQSKLRSLPGIKLIFNGKAFDNQNLLLKVQNIYWWSIFTSFLSEHGFRVSAKPLQPCREFDKLLGVDVEYISPTEIKEEVVISEWKFTVYDQGIQTDNYTNYLLKSSKGAETIVKGKRHKYACYRSYGDLPVKLLILTAMLPPLEEQHNREIIRPETKMSVDLRLLQNMAAAHDKLKCFERN